MSKVIRTRAVVAEDRSDAQSEASSDEEVGGSVVGPPPRVAPLRLGRRKRVPCEEGQSDRPTSLEPLSGGRRRGLRVISNRCAIAVTGWLRPCWRVEVVTSWAAPGPHETEEARRTAGNAEQLRSSILPGQRSFFGYRR